MNNWSSVLPAAEATVGHRSARGGPCAGPSRYHAGGASIRLIARSSTAITFIVMKVVAIQSLVSRRLKGKILPS